MPGRNYDKKGYFQGEKLYKSTAKCHKKEKYH